MYKFQYEISKINIELLIPFECEEEERFKPFKTEGTTDMTIQFHICKEKPVDIGEKIYDSDIHVFKKDKQLCLEHFLYVKEKPYAWLIWNTDTPKQTECFILEEDVQYCRKMGHIFQLIRLEQVCMINQGMILHSSFIKCDEKAILFTAPSGTGKSTQALLWEKYRDAEIINGDRTIIRRIDNKWKASGLPYAGSSNIFKNKTVNIKAIIVLRQGIENTVERLKPVDAFKWLYSEMILRSWDLDYQMCLTDNLLQLVRDVPVYYFNCLPDKSAVEKLESYMECEL